MSGTIFSPDVGDYIITVEGYNSYMPLEVLGIQSQPHTAYVRVINSEHKFVVLLEQQEFYPASKSFVAGFKDNFKIDNVTVEINPLLDQAASVITTETF